jgi:hypothetical protein
MSNQNPTIPWHNNTVVFYDLDTSVSLVMADFLSEYAHAFYKTQSGYQPLQPAFDLNFSDCYFIEMTFQYSEYYAPVAAFLSDVYQIVILDQSLVPVWIGIGASKAVS